MVWAEWLLAELSPPVLRDHGIPAGLKWLGEYMEKYGMQVTVTVPEDDRVILPEEQAVLLFQSVRELLMNSWKHAGTAQATVTMAREADILRIEVSDQGKGFQVAEADRLTEVSSKFGLFSIRERMKSLGGSFDIRSRPGQGTRCMLALPLAPPLTGQVRPTPGTVEGVVERGQVYQSNGVIRVLLADDHAMVRQGLRSVLAGYPDVEVVAEAADGEEVMEAVERFHPTVVVMDSNMPKVNGIEATARLKAKYPRLHVIGLSINAGADNREAIMKAGAQVLITKEAAVEQLYGVIQSAVKETL